MDQHLPKPPAAPRLSPRVVTLTPSPELVASQAGSDAVVAELDVARASLESHTSEFVELESVRVGAGSLADGDWYRTTWVDVDLTGVDAANVVLTESGLKRVAWHHCRLTGFTVSGCTLTDVAFDESPMTMAMLRFATLERVRFDGCDLSGADLTNARLRDVTFTDCRFDGATFTHATCERVLVAGGSLSGIRGLDGLRGATFRLDTLDEIAQEMAVALGFRLVET